MFCCGGLYSDLCFIFTQKSRKTQKNKYLDLTLSVSSVSFVWPFQAFFIIANLSWVSTCLVERAKSPFIIQE